MAKANREKISDALDILRDGLTPFVERELKAHFGDNWKKEATDGMRWVKDGDEWDAAVLLAVMWDLWNVVFRDILSRAERSIVSELREYRNNWAHQKSFSSDDTYRAMDSMERLLEAVSAGEQALKINQQKMEVMRLKLAEQTRHDAKQRAKVATEGKPAPGLVAWRDVIEPHDDVASGNYQQAEFAADLHQVFTNRATPEYGDASEFFRRTYLTRGLGDLLTTALKRLVNNQGDPVVALQTNFGGGKTHSMLALYHLFSGVQPSELANVDELISSLGIEALPKVNRAVLVGQYLSPGKVHKMPDGTKVRTLWGELAWQLAGKKGYKLVKEADESSTNPGRTLVELFDMAGPSLILIDEWVAYARQLYEKHDLPAGSFDTQFTFAQALTEAASSSKNIFVVVSIPSSDIEVGGMAGKEALHRLENVVARKEATWQPASSEEGFEIVRRRLFKPIATEDRFRQRDAVVRAFIETYRANGKEFPTEAASADYEKRMQAAYPIHPDLFDRLYSEWSTLDRFQRTRGVLRLMAAVIHELWENEDKNLMILPGMLPLQQPAVTKELTRYLEPSWPVIVETDVDGPESTALGIDRENSTLGRFSATRRVARTVFLGTAPMQGTGNRGKDIREIHLGCIQPGESLATFGDALRRLQNKARYLHTDGERTFFDVAQNISRDAESRKNDFSGDAVHERIIELMRKIEATNSHFQRVHACPATPTDVVDEPTARLVIFGPEETHTSANNESPAMKAAEAFLNSKGSGPRIYRNMLVFVAPDRTRLGELEDAVRWTMAWEAIYTKRDELNLNPSQVRTAETKKREWEGVVRQRISETYCWLIVPTQLKSSDSLTFDAQRLRGADSIGDRAAKKLAELGALTDVYGSNLLKMNLDGIPLWRGNHVSIKQLCDDFAQYLYLPRLKNQKVLVDSIRQGVSMLTWRDDGFAYAQDYDTDRDRYIGLFAGNATLVSVDDKSLVVKPDVAAAQLDAEKKREKVGPEGGQGGSTDGADGGPNGGNGDVGNGDGTVAVVKTKPRRFYGAVKVDAKRLGRDAGKISEEVLSHLAGLPGASAEVTLEIQVDIPDGAPDHVVRTVTENCRTLKFDSQGFEES